MALNLIGHAVLLAVTFIFVCGQYIIPDVKIQAFKPKGLRASIEDAPSMAFFKMYGNVNWIIGPDEKGDINIETNNSTGGMWVVEDPNRTMIIGDFINYYIVVRATRGKYRRRFMKAKDCQWRVHKIPELEDISAPISTTPPPALSTLPTAKSRTSECRPTLTRVRGGVACAGQTLFEDNFDNFQENIWQEEQYIPIQSIHPEAPFVSYQHNEQQPTVSTSNGFLSIKPTLQQNLPGFNSEHIYTGTLNLFSRCTAVGEACSFKASGANILPPVVTGRIASKNFAFTYGTVHVRAKLPQGDWLYPEILLESCLKKYGSRDYASGAIKIVSARGNRELRVGAKDYSNQVLYGGPIMDFQCRTDLLKSKVNPTGNQWGDHFHVYSLHWTPDHITLSVDGDEWGRIEPAESDMVGQLSQTCPQVPRALLALGSKMAPFDDYFYLSFGVAAGGTTEFPSGAVTGDNHPIPWNNENPKAKLTFWRDMDTWIQTWTQPELLIDYVKVVAL